MKFEEKIKEKILYRSGFSVLKLIYFIVQKFKNRRFIRKSFSGASQDLVINYFFKNLNDGFYIDVGCYHPYNGNNTKLLYDKGWSGINIDLDFSAVDFFKFVRKRDENLNFAISNNEEEKNLYFYHNHAAINSLTENKKNKHKELKKIQTKTLNSILEKSKFRYKQLNLLCIDVEGHELEVLQSIDLIKYKPDMVVVEYIDENMKKIEYHNQNINTVLESNIYKHMINNNYHFVNWLHSDLIFVHISKRDN